MALQKKALEKKLRDLLFEIADYCEISYGEIGVIYIPLKLKILKKQAEEAATSSKP